MLPMVRFGLLIFLFFFISSVQAVQQQNPLLSVGVPPIATFQSSLDINPDSHSIAIGNEGFVYVGVNTGVQVFDGETWQLIEMPNRKMVRTLSPGPGRRMYVGGYDSFGYIEPDTTGQLVFHDLSQEFTSLRNAGYADIWDLLVTDNAVYFKAVKDLFRYDLATQSTSVWQFEGRFGAINQLNGEVYVQYRGLGLAQYQQGNFELVSQHSLWQEHIYDLVDLGDNTWLANTRSGQWLHIANTTQPSQPNHLVPNEFNLTGLPTGDEFYDVVDVRPGYVALAHKSGSVFMLDWNQQRLEQYPISFSVILQIAKGADGSLYALAEQSVIRLDWPSPWRFVGPQSGLRGRVHNIRNWGERWFALTSAGVSELLYQPEPHFEKVHWTNHEAWDLLAIGENRALLADSYSLHLLAEDGVSQLSHGSLYPRIIQPSSFSANTYLIGTELGLAIWQDGNPLILEWNEPGTLVNSIYELSTTTLLLGTAHRGVIRVTLSDDRKMVTQVQYLGEESGLRYGTSREAKLSTFENKVLISTEVGLYEWSNNTATNENDGLSDVLEEQQVITIQGGINNDYWAYSYNHLYHYNGSDSDQKQWSSIPASELIPGAITTLFVPRVFSQYVILGSHSSLLAFEPKTEIPNFETLPIRMNSVQRITSEGAQRLNINDVYTFDAGRAAIRFDFSLPVSSANGEALYRARLDGYEEEFSEWNQSTRITYSNLSPNTYSFFVQAKSPSGEISSTPPFRFTITPPWYQHGLFIFAMFLLSVSLLFLLFRFILRRRTRRLAFEKKKLKLMVEERTRDLASANKKLESMANVDGLTGIANRRRLDQYLGESVHHCVNSEKPLALLQIDVDHFKAYNDTHGHLAGDQVLSQVASCLQNCIRRQEDLVARFGGEEFTVVMPGASSEHAFDVAESMRKNVEENIEGITVSIGVSVIHPEHMSVPEHAIQNVLESADKALYSAKDKGRNQVR